ncbi:hypothetical protein AB4500_20880, partial [Vibrio sp. 10N.222.48.A11]
MQRSDESGISGQLLTSSEIEVLLSVDLKQNKSVALLEQSFCSTSLFVPKIQGSNSQYTLTMTDWSHPDKVLLYKAMIASYNYVFFDKEASIYAKRFFAHAARSFIEWLNVHVIESRYKILKAYEADRMEALNNHGGSSPLRRLIGVLNYAIDSAVFRDEISADDYQFLRELKKIKVSPNLNKSQKSLASYFGALDWLRRDDIGIGKGLCCVI